MALFVALLLAMLGAGPVYVQGPLSVYWPHDGFNRGFLACGDAPFTKDQVHVAVRNWRSLGCGRKVLVCAKSTGRCVLTSVRDSGPWGAYRGPLRRAVPEGRWKVMAGASRLPVGWKWRAVVDLSVGLWVQLGKPPGLSTVHMMFLPRPGTRPGTRPGPRQALPGAVALAE
jgi:hypothetical protein